MKVSRNIEVCLRDFYGGFKGVSRVFQECFKEVSRVFHETLKEEEVSSMFQGCFNIFKYVSRMFQKCFKDVSGKLSRCFKKVSCCMALIAASRAEGGLVF